MTPCGRYRLFDASGMRPWHVHLGFLRQDAGVQRTLQDLYPQLLGGIFVANMPGFVKALWETIIRVCLIA